MLSIPMRQSVAAVARTAHRGRVVTMTHRRRPFQSTSAVTTGGSRNNGYQRSRIAIPTSLQQSPFPCFQISSFATQQQPKKEEEEIDSSTTATTIAPSSFPSSSKKDGDVRVPSRILGTTRVPTPPSAPPVATNPLQSYLVSPKKMIRKVVDLTVSASATLLRFLFQLPGNIFYYITHPTETRQQYEGMKKMVKDELHHYWVGTKVRIVRILDIGTLLRLFGLYVSCPSTASLFAHRSFFIC
jgi:hypothetical protein